MTELAHKGVLALRVRETAVDTDMISVLRAERAGFALREVKIGHFDIFFLGEIEHFLFVCESGIRNFQRSSVLSFRFYETAIADIRLRQPTVQAAGEALLFFASLAFIYSAKFLTSSHWASVTTVPLPNRAAFADFSSCILSSSVRSRSDGFTPRASASSSIIFIVGVLPPLRQ